MKGNITKLVVGLGNHSLPSTRHSIGMSVVNLLAENLGINWAYDKKCLGFIAKFSYDNGHVLLLKPKLAMNINGKSILRTVNQFRVPIENIVLIQDDLDKPLGKIRLKYEGTASGHNGVKSAIAAFKTDKLKRYKIGIGRPNDKSEVVDYVLSHFCQNELSSVDGMLTKCVGLLIKELQIQYVQEKGKNVLEENATISLSKCTQERNIMKNALMENENNT